MPFYADSTLIFVCVFAFVFVIYFGRHINK